MAKDIRITTPFHGSLPHRNPPPYRYEIYFQDFELAFATTRYINTLRKLGIAHSITMMTVPDQDLMDSYQLGMPISGMVCKLKSTRPIPQA